MRKEVDLNGTVYGVTDEYSLFENLPENRLVDERLQSTKTLNESIKRLGTRPEFPIVCVPNGTKLLVKCGHHRKQLAEKQKQPIYYIIGKDDIDIYELEHATTRWTLLNWLQARSFKNKDYKKVMQYMNESGIPLSSLIQLLSKSYTEMGGGPKVSEFKKGNFSIGDTDHANKVQETVIYLKNIVEIPFANSRAFVNAISSCLKVEGFSLSLFKKKAKVNKWIFEKQPSKQGYLKIIESVYNHGNRKPIPLAFEASKVK